MKIRNLQINLIVLTVFYFNFTNAQNLNLNPIIGTSVENYAINLSISDTGSVGSNQTWDFSNFSTSENIDFNYTVFAPDQNEQTLYPSCNSVLIYENGYKYYYFGNEDSLTYLGAFVQNQNGIFQNPQKVIEYPCVENVVYNDSIYLELDNTYLTGNNSWSIVGQGTLITPYETYENAYKLKSTSTGQLYMNGTLIQEINQISYAWYDSNHFFSLLTIKTENGAITQSRVFSSQNLGLQNKVLDKGQLQIYPNPVQSEANFNLNLIGKVSISNLQGETILQKQVSNEKSINVADLTPGTYVVKIETNEKTYFQKFTKL